MSPVITYQLVSQFGQPCSVNKFIDDKQVASIPFDPANTDYQAYLKYVEDGGEVLPAETEAITWDAIRAKRDQLILESDWTMTPGATVDQGQWSAYRQILRDLPQTFAATGPESVIWPTAPSTSGPNSDPVE